MKLELKGGNNNVQKEVVTGPYAEMKKAMPTKPIKGKNNQIKIELSKEKKEEKVVENKVEVKEEVPAVESVKNTDGETVEVKKAVVSPVTFDESLIREHKSTTDPIIENKATDVELLESLIQFGCKEDSDAGKRIKLMTYVESIFERVVKLNDSAEDNSQGYLEVFAMLTKMMSKMMDSVDNDTKAVIDESLSKVFAEKIDELVAAKLPKKEVISPVSFDESLIKEHEVTTDPIVVEELTVKQHINKLMDTLGDIIESEEYSDECVIEVLASPVINNIIESAVVDIEGRGYDISEDGVCLKATTSLCLGGDEETYAYSKDLNDIDIKVTTEMMVEALESMGYSITTAVDENAPYGGLTYYAAKVVNTKEISPDVTNGVKAIVIIDNEGNYLTRGSNNDIIVIDMIDDRSVNKLSIVSASYLKQLQDDIAIRPEDAEAIEEVKTTVPTGVFAPTTDTSTVDLGVNGVSMK